MTERWYKDDPMARGSGLGIVVHERRRRWVVATVLRQSPAEKAGVRAGDIVTGMDGYELAHGDHYEFLRLLRTRRARGACALSVRRGRKGTTVPVTPTVMLRILDTHRRLSGGVFDLGTACHTCNLCLPSIAGFAECGLDSPDPINKRRCRFPCMIA